MCEEFRRVLADARQDLDNSTHLCKTFILHSYFCHLWHYRHTVGCECQAQDGAQESPLHAVLFGTGCVSVLKWKFICTAERMCGGVGVQRLPVAVTSSSPYMDDVTTDVDSITPKENINNRDRTDNNHLLTQRCQIAVNFAKWRKTFKLKYLGQMRQFTYLLFILKEPFGSGETRDSVIPASTECFPSSAPVCRS